MPAKAGRRIGSAMLWSALGFVTGAIFWHAVGFWTFMSDVVLHQPAESNAGILHAKAPAVAVPRIVLVDPATCTALALDRRSNQTVVRPCPRDSLALRLQPDGRRGDLPTPVQPTIQAAGYRANTN